MVNQTNRMPPTRIAVVILLLVGVRPAAAQLRVMTYNLLNYPGTAAVQAARDPAFRTIIQAADPHIILAQEVQTLSNANTFLTSVLNVIAPGEWAVGPFRQGPDTNNALFYKPASVSYLSGDPGAFVWITTDLRDIDRWKLRPAGYTSAAASFYAYSAHLKASSGASNADQRNSEATDFRNNANSLPAGTKFIVAGDFNLYSSNELLSSGSTNSAYWRFVESQANNNGRCRDPFNLNLVQQAWDSSSTFRTMHTQSTRTGTLSPSDGGATGGLDSRFDFVLLSYPMYPDNPLGQGLAFISGSTVILGNDGNHFNQDINTQPNTAVSVTVANALQRASDHLPVFVSLQVPAKASTNSPLDFGRCIVSTPVQRTLTVTNTAAAEVVSGADVLLYTLAPPTGFTTPPPVPPATQFTEPALNGFNSHAVTMSIGQAGVVSATLTVNSNDLDVPALGVSLNATVLRHAVPSLAAASQTLSGTVDFGSHPPGAFSSHAVNVFNVGFGSLQALLNVHAFDISGGAASRFGLSGFASVDVGASPAAVTVTLDDSGALPPGMYTATLRLHSRDEQGVAGAGNLSDLNVTLSAQVLPRKGDLNLSGAVDAADVPLFVNVLLGIDSDPLRNDLADFDLSGTADGDDLAAFLAALP